MAYKLINDFLIGCDPEFLGLNSSGKLVNFRNRLPHEGEVGYDHNGWAGELRPEPARGTYGILRRLRKLILGMPNFRGVSKLRGGAYYEGDTEEDGRRVLGLGGHVHFGLDPINAATGSYTPEHQQRVKALNYFVQYCEALDILPRNECASRRTNTEYGRLGDVRLPHQGSGYRTEYRSMASWLYQPASAMVCLTGAKVAAVDPAGTIEALQKYKSASFEALKNWLDQYKSKDTNVRRVTEVLLEKGHQSLVATPDADIRESWKELPC
jgi:hypothetical protein